MADAVVDGTTLAVTPLARATVSQQIREQLIERIRGGDLAPGSPVPSERVLCEQFGVARTSVREAMQGLVSMGLVQRRGNRSFVAEQLPGVVVPDDRRKAFVSQLFETRRVLELPIFELAATRADDEQRARIAEIADAFGRKLTLAEFRTLDRRFHTAVAHACGNPLLLELYGKVLDALFQSSDFTSLLYDSANRREVGRIVRQSGLDHQAIARAVAAGDVVGTVAATEQHLHNVEQRMLDDLV